MRGRKEKLVRGEVAGGGRNSDAEKKTDEESPDGKSPLNEEALAPSIRNTSSGWLYLELTLITRW